MVALRPRGPAPPPEQVLPAAPAHPRSLRRPLRASPPRPRSANGKCDSWETARARGKERETRRDLERERERGDGKVRAVDAKGEERTVKWPRIGRFSFFSLEID